jgi:hypothetical protein
MKNKFLLLCLLFLISSFAYSQGLEESFDSEIQFRKTGMLVLGSWATANIIGGLALRSNTDGTTKYFHEMNAIWNGVNLGIATFGYISAMKMAQPESGLALYNEQIGLDKTLLFNAGLDLAYIATGFYLKERAKNTSDRPERLRGYGNSIILQGAFLFAFDVAMVLVHKKIRLGEEMILSFDAMPNGLRMAMTF